MKKVYMAPATETMNTEMENIICASVTTVGGNSGITMGEGDAPASADSRSWFWE